MVILGLVSTSDGLRLLWFPCLSSSGAELGWCSVHWFPDLSSRQQSLSMKLSVSLEYPTDYMHMAEAERRMLFCHCWDDITWPRELPLVSVYTCGKGDSRLEEIMAW